MKVLISCVLAIVLMISTSLAQTQPSTTAPGRRGRGPAGPSLTVTADHADWNYLPGENVKFTIRGPAGLAITYQIGPEMMPAEAKSATIPESGLLVMDGETLKDPGFLRCIAAPETAARARGGLNGAMGKGLATAAFSPEKIKPTQTEPADFDAFWDKAKAELAKVPIDAKLTPMPSETKEKYEAWELNLQNIGTPPATTSRFYGILYVPRGEGPFPAMICFPGAGVRGPDREATFGWATRGFITLYVGIHEMPVVPVEGAPAAQVPNSYPTMGLDNPDQYYFRRVLMGCLRGDDYLVTHPKWDKKNLVSVGGSQGGYLSLATTGLDPRITSCIVEFPAFCDLTGYIHSRAGGYPRFTFEDKADPDRDAKIKTTSYYDGVNFAKRIKVTGYYGWGYNDETCPPDSTFSAYNVITAPKKLNIVKEMGHGRAAGFLDSQREWMLKLVGKTNQ